MMNKFVNVVKLSMLSALTAGLTMGTVVESAEARFIRVSGSSNDSLDADFILDTETRMIEVLKLEKNGVTLSGASTGMIVDASEFTDSNLEEFDLSLEEFDFGRIDNENVTPAIQYDLTFDTDKLEKGTLYIPSIAGINMDSPFETFDNIFEIESNKGPNGEIEIPGILISTLNDQKQVELFGVNGGSGPFTATEIKKQDIPESTTAAGLLATLFVSGLSLRKGDRRIKSKAIIKD